MGSSLVGGWLEVIAGCMYSGKSEEMLRRVRRAQVKYRVEVFKPDLDTRYGVNKVASHAKAETPCFPVPKDDPEWILRSWVKNPERGATDVSDWTWDAPIVALDEVQFFNPSVIAVCRTLVRNNIRVIAAGLDLDFRGRPFGPMPDLLVLADEVHKLTATCTTCGGQATRSQRLTPSQELVQLGAKDAYEARCHLHHTITED